MDQPTYPIDFDCPYGPHKVRLHAASGAMNAVVREHIHLAHPEVSGPFLWANDVQFYSEHARALAYPQQHKVLRILENKGIEYAGGGVYICKPIQGYNVTTYRLEQPPGRSAFSCSCQFNATTGLPCSHIGALHEFLKRESLEDEFRRSGRMPGDT